MPYALVPIVEIGPSTYRPGLQRRMALGLDQGGKCLRLGSDRALIWTPNPIVDARAEIVAEDKAEAISGRTRTVFRTLRDNDGRTIPTIFADAVADLMVTPPVGRWNPLRPTRAGMLEIHLGGLLWSQPVIQGGVDISDDFNRAGNLAGSTTSDAQTTWVEDQGAAWVTDGDEASCPGVDAFYVARLAAAMATADHYAEANLTTFSRPSGGLFPGVTVRVNSAFTSGYGFEVGHSGAAASRRIYDVADDSTIETDATATTSGLLYLEFDGSTYTCKVAGVTIFTNTDTAHDGTIKGVGITCYAASDAVAGFTSFRGADLGGATNTDRNPLVVAVTLTGVAPANVYGTLIEVPTP